MSGDDGQCQETSKALKTKGETDSDTGRCHAPNTPPTVQTGDCHDCANVRTDDKPDDKLQITDPDLQQVIDAWADLPEAVKTGILAGQCLPGPAVATGPTAGPADALALLQRPALSCYYFVGSINSTGPNLAALVPALADSGFFPRRCLDRSVWE